MLAKAYNTFNNILQLLKLLQKCLKRCNFFSYIRSLDIKLGEEEHSPHAVTGQILYCKPSSASVYGQSISASITVKPISEHGVSNVLNPFRFSTNRYNSVNLTKHQHV